MSPGQPPPDVVAAQKADDSRVSTRVSDVWRADPEAYGSRRARRPCAYQAYVPDQLETAAVQIPGDLAADVAEVERQLVAFGTRSDSLAGFLLRAEAVASSRIEGVEVSARRLARRAAGLSTRDTTADEVLGNVEAMRLAVDLVASADRISRDDVLRIHTALMERSSTPRLAGVIRITQNWIGGNQFNPCEAAFVPPPPGHVLELIDDLCAFMNRDDLPGVLQAAVAHAQFETIHPFGDGNGRTGRALIHVVLRRRGLATGFVPPISLALARNTTAYIAGLTAYHYDGPSAGEAALAGVGDWVRVFVSATRRAVRDAELLRERLAELEGSWRDTLKPVPGSAGDRLLPFLMANPVVSADDVVRLIGVSADVAYLALDRAVAAGIVTPIRASARNRLFEAREVFGVLTDYERGSRD